MAVFFPTAKIIMLTRRWALPLALFAACLRPLWAEFMVLDPTDYRDHYTEGWPGPHDDGSGVGVVNLSSCKF